MGVVLLVEHAIVGRLAAMKVLYAPADMKTDNAAIPRFKIEADLLSSLRHPNVPEFYDADLLADGTAILVIEYLDGYDLAATLQRVGKLDLGDALFVVSEVLRPLIIMHVRSVHRDLKPSNIFLCRKPSFNSEGSLEKGRVRLLDFGVAKLKGRRGPTKENSLVGTIFHMSPEQLRGNDLDGRSDLYALGLVLYEMLKGHPLFIPDVEDPPHLHAITYKHMNVVPDIAADLPDVPEDVRAFLARLLEKDPEKRFPRAEAASRVARDLREKYYRDSTLFTEDVDDVVDRIDRLQAERVKPPPAIVSSSSGNADAVSVARVVAVTALPSTTDQTPPPSGVRALADTDRAPDEVPAPVVEAAEAPLPAVALPSLPEPPPAQAPPIDVRERDEKDTLPTLDEPPLENDPKAKRTFRMGTATRTSVPEEQLTFAEEVRHRVRTPRIFRRPALVQTRLGMGIFELATATTTIGSDDSTSIRVRSDSIVPHHATITRLADGRLALEGAPGLEQGRIAIDREPLRAARTVLLHNTELAVGDARFIVTDLAIWDPRGSPRPTRTRSTPAKIDVYDSASRELLSSLPITAPLTLVGSSLACELVVSGTAPVFCATWLRGDGEVEILQLGDVEQPDPVVGAAIVDRGVAFDLPLGRLLVISDTGGVPVVAPAPQAPTPREAPRFGPPPMKSQSQENGTAPAASLPTSKARPLVRVTPPKQEVAPPQAAPPTRPVAPDVLVVTGRRGAEPRLGANFELRKDTIVIGSGARCDIRIASADVGERHVELTRKGVGQWAVLDLGTPKGTFVNRVRVQSGLLRHRDYLELSSSVSFQLECAGEPKR